jgi:hypothetical protein
VLRSSEGLCRCSSCANPGSLPTATPFCPVLKSHSTGYLYGATFLFNLTLNYNAFLYEGPWTAFRFPKQLEYPCIRTTTLPQQWNESAQVMRRESLSLLHNKGRKSGRAFGIHEPNSSCDWANRTSIYYASEILISKSLCSLS